MSAATVVVLVVSLAASALQEPALTLPPEPVAVARHETRADLTRQHVQAAEAHAAWHAEQERLAAEREAAVASVWDRLAACESGGEWDYGPHSGWGSGIYQGGLQFHPSTWDAYRPAGYPAEAYLASRAQQVAVAELVLAAQGWGAWPACSRKLGLR